MLRLLSSMVEKCKKLWKPSKPCHVGIHWKAPAEYFHMSTHLPGFQSFSNFLHHFVLAKLATSSIYKGLNPGISLKVLAIFHKGAFYLSILLMSGV